MKPLVPDAEVLLSAIARVSSADEGEVAKAFAAGFPYARTGETSLSLLPQNQCGLQQIDRIAENFNDTELATDRRGAQSTRVRCAANQEEPAGSRRAHCRR